MNDRQRLEAIISVVCKYLPPDGISREQAMNEIIGLIDPLPAQQEQEPPKYSFKAHWEKDGRIGIAGVVVRPDGGVHVLQDTIDPPEQEPVKDWVASHNAICALLRQAHDALALTSYPMKRAWVGLSEDDKVLINHDANFNQFMTAGEYADRVQQLTEARLKDKNT